VTGALHAQTLGPVDWVFLVDTSKSMRGIWPEVKASLDTFVQEKGAGDTVSIYAFDRDVRAIQTETRSDLTPEGNRTHLGAAIATGLEHAEQMRRIANTPTRRQVVVLFTDGKEDVRGIRKPVRIDASLDRVGKTFVYFVSMGEHEPQLDDFAARTTPQTTVLKAPTAEVIRNVVCEVRAQIEPPHPPPPKPQPKPKPKVVAPPPPPEPSFPWVKVSIALALLAFIAFLFLQQQRSRNRLEGELEILRPRAAPEVAFVGLPRLQANEVALSAILPLEILGGNDARLFVRRKGNRKKVWIAAQSGSLRVNDVETPMSELYDADTIEIGDAKVRFNRVGDERPLASDQEGEL
jgi:hypothetical protein